MRDIIKELEKPGRDPRPEFKTATFRDGIETMKDLQPAMLLEGVITNITNFGAFVDIGVHQDGLVHISAITNKFIKDPREVLKTGDVVKVKVIEVDVARNRIALGMRLEDEVTQQKDKPASKKPIKAKPPQQQKPRMPAKPANNAMAAAFANLKK